MKKKQHILLTGDRPTGKLHLGHFVGSLQERVALQDDPSYDRRFILVADIQALASHAGDPVAIRDNVSEVVLDYLSVGIDPEKTTICVQSAIPAIAELTMYFMNLVSVAQLQHNPTIKTEMKDKGFSSSVPVGFLAHPVHQAADILAFHADRVPVGSDQEPLIEQANDIVKKFNSIYGETFSPIKALISSTPRLMGIDGKAKMSKSLGNAIFLSDSQKEVEKKVMSMYTDPSHIKVSDPGKVEGNVVFSYLDIFDPEKEEVSELKKQYKKGGLGDVEIKKRLIGVLNDFLNPFREKRALYEKDPDIIKEILQKGTADACLYTENVMSEVRKHMGISYL